MSQQMDKEIRTFISNHPKSKDMQAEASKYLPGGSSRATAYFDPYPFFVDKTSGHHEYDVDGNEIYRYDLKVEHNLGLVEDFEVDLENNIWLFSKDGSIYVLDDNYQLIKNFTYLNIDSSSKCLNLYIDDEAHYLCTYIKDSELGILSFSYDMMNRPIWK